MEIEALKVDDLVTLEGISDRVGRVTHLNDQCLEHATVNIYPILNEEGGIKKIGFTVEVPLEVVTKLG